VEIRPKRTQGNSQQKAANRLAGRIFHRSLLTKINVLARRKQWTGHSKQAEELMHGLELW
jgi:hypothetical protein